MKNANSNKLFGINKNQEQFDGKIRKNQVQLETNKHKEQILDVKPSSLEDTHKHEKFEKEILEEKTLKFKFAAIVMDRFFLCLSFIYAVVTFVGIIMSNSNFYKS